MKHVHTIRRLGATCVVGAVGFLGAALAAEPGWVSLADGKTFTGWKPSENTNTWTLQDGAFVAHGERSHLFYVADPQPFVNFEFEAEVMTKPGSNGGVFFHTKWQEKDWPKAGMEVQVNNTYAKDPIRTASLYQIRNVLVPPAKDNEWFKLYFKVENKRIVIKVNGQELVDYTEPADKKPEGDRPRLFDKGTFALQGHDPGSTVFYRNIRVKRLP